MPKLYVKCKTCNTEFASGISVNEKSFKTLILSGNLHTCPKGHTHAYDKKEYFKARSALTEFLKNAFIPWSPNPGLNLTAIITILGLSILGLSALLSQIPDFGSIDPNIIEIGKFAFYTGMGRATGVLFESAPTVPTAPNP
jgi:hypothetical protein